MESFKQEISSHIAAIFKDLESFVVEEKLIGRLGCGYWPNLGWISYYPHNLPEEESIDLCFSFSGENKTGTQICVVDICWSDGIPVQGLFEYRKGASEDFGSWIGAIFEHSKLQVVSEMKKQISASHPPHYRID